MFAVTKNLLLRPGWSCDAPALAKAMGSKRIVANLASAPWPYGLEQAEAFLAQLEAMPLPTMLITRRRDAQVIGVVGFGYAPSGEIEIGYWIAEEHWGKGYATEAARAALEIARTLGWSRIEAGHFLDNPASGRVLEKLGFVATGAHAMRHSCGRGEEAMSRLYRLDLNGCEQAATAAA
ncbi:GNAT family N-acetyltransferase [Sphingomicrobium astaxanthinifaciens]|uniref:GNAT family N-acetyltransferase n=1 Tax=Sphingomicrobium astaxanthinifaciens TaxID=1227949 RepID=UPI001FCAFB1A|nr:GNAT family N-acetyltransferase [Sphingomicrobium astaxanthinifaciens]MCJ7420802.1 GNAT family N-acetyltransferase [Sphingomicrobium astaxanthinifaciens]